jgi:hypothetical protein
MRKLKKILAATLAGAMLSCMTMIPSYAENPSEVGGVSEGQEQVTTTTTTNESALIPVTKVLDVNTGTALPTMTFEFKLTPRTDVTEKNKQRDGYSLVNGILNDGDLNSSISELTATVTFDGSEEKKATGGIGLDEYSEVTNFDFSKVKYPEGSAVRYVYRVEEVVDSTKTSYITYDTKTYEDVEVTVDNTGNILYIESYTGDTLDKGVKDTLKFTNKCNATSIVVSKELDGNGIQTEDSNTEFNFSFYIPAAADNVEDKTLSKVTGDLYIAPGQTFDTTIERTNGDKENTTVGIGIAYDFKLKAGDTFTINSVPVGMIYQVKENLEENSDYTCYISARKIEDNQSKDVQKLEYENNTYEGKTVSDGNPVTFINNKEVPSITGVMLDVAPYVLIFLLVIAGTIVFFVRKRRIVK